MAEAKTTSLSDFLVGKGRKTGGIKTHNSDGMTLPMAFVAEIATQLGLPVTASGAAIFDSLTNKVVGKVYTPEGKAAKAAEELWIGRKLTISAQHPELCSELGIPAASGGVAVFKALLEKAISSGVLHDPA